MESQRPPASTTSPATAPRSPGSNDVALLAAVFDAATEAFLIADDERRYVAANASACVLLGRTLAELLSMRVDDLARPADRQWVDQAWAAFLAEGSQAGPMEIVRSDGEVRHVEYRAKARIAPGLHLSQLTDVTGRVHRERQLEAELAARVEARYTEAFDALTYPVVVMRPVRNDADELVDEEIVYANPSWRRQIMRGDQSDPAGRRIRTDFPHFAERQALRQRVLETGEPYRSVMTIPGGHRLFDVEYVKAGDSVIAISRDVTAAEETAAALEQAEVAGRTGHWTWVPGLAQGEGSPVCSAGVYRILGLDPAGSALDRDSLQRSLTADSLARSYAAVETTLATGQPYFQEVEFVRPDGSQGWAEVRGARTGSDAQSFRLIGTLVDITDRRRAEERYRLTIETMLDPLVILRPCRDAAGAIVDFVHVYANAAALAANSVTHEQQVGRHLGDHLPAHESARLIAAYARVIETGEPLVLDNFAYTDRWGGVERGRVSDIRANRLGDELVSIWRDVTERQRIARELVDRGERLAVSERELREAQRVAHVGNWTLDAATGAVEWSEEIFRICGLPFVAGPLDAARQREVFAAFGEQVARRRAQNIARLLETGEPYEYETTLHRPDGEARRILSRGEAVRDPDGRIVGGRGTVSDVTERWQATEALRASEARYAELAERIPVGVYACRTPPAGDIVLDYISPQGRRLLGLDADVPLTQAAWGSAGLHPQDAGGLWAQSDASRAGLVPFKWEGRWSVGGRPRLVRLEALPLPLSDGWIRWDGVIEDVTERRELEARLLQSQRLEAVGQLAGGVAHDFNNMLAVIAGYAEFVRDSLPPDAAAREDIDAVLVAAERATALTRQLLTFSRRQSLRPETLDPSAVIGQLLPLLRRLIGEHIQLDVSTSGEIGCVRIDRSQLDQLITNLVVNARDAMPDGGRVVIALENRSSLLADGSGGPQPCVRMTVTDTGTGMDAATTARAFEPFFSTKGTGQNSGLGLATAYGVVTQSGGVITVASSPGAGSTFTIDLPRAEGAVPAELPQQRTAPVGARERVLLVEDDPGVRVVLARSLRSLDYEVLEVDGPDAALALPDETLASIDLLVSDVLMPGMNGPRLVEILAARKAGLRALLVSGYSPDALPLDTPGIAFLRKPFTQAEFAIEVRRLLDAP